MTETKMTNTPSGLQYHDEIVGQGGTATSGQTVSVHYTGWLTNGQKFDSSKDRGQPFSFKLGAGQVIKGIYHRFIIGYVLRTVGIPIP